MAAWLLLALAGCNLGSDTRPRNLLLIVIDTLRQDHLPCYGYHRDTAPTVCRLAGEGVLVDGLSPSSWTKPATATLLTGLHPLRHQAIERNDLLPEAAITLAEVLSSRGFTTLASSANGWISPHFGFGQGFGDFLKIPGTEGVPADADVVNQALLPRLESLTEPYFLYVHYVDPHHPYSPAMSWDGQPLDPRLARVAPVTKEDLDMANFVLRDPQLVRDAIDLYDGEIRSVDQRIAELLARLEKLGLMDSTLTVITSDHGEEFEEHGRVGHGMTLYDEVTRVPLIFHAPGPLSPRIHAGTVNLADLFPTVLKLLRVKPNERAQMVDGVSQVRAMKGAETDSAVTRGHLLHLELDRIASLAYQRDHIKLLLAREPYRKELLLLGDQDAEQRNVLWLTTLSPELSDLSRELAEAYNHLRSRAFDRVTVQTAEEMAGNLEALGYVAPTRDTVRPRQLPHRVRAADDKDGGLLGWEPIHLFESCIATADSRALQQLLQGWRFPELQGRWTLPPGATVALARPAAPRLSIALTGANFRPGTFRLRVHFDNETALDREIPPGPFELRETIFQENASSPIALLRIEADPSFEPPQRGDRQWILGTFLRSICLEPA